MLASPDARSGRHRFGVWFAPTARFTTATTPFTIREHAIARRDRAEEAAEHPIANRAKNRAEATAIDDAPGAPMACQRFDGELAQVSQDCIMVLAEDDVLVGTIG